MNFVPILSKILLSILLATTVLYRYGNWFRHHVIVTAVVLLAWCFSLLIIFILPLDVISVSITMCFIFLEMSYIFACRLYLDNV